MPSRNAYQKYPQHYVWQSRQKHWTKQKQGFAISRLYTAHPKEGKCFYVRFLLTIVCGPRSFEDLQIINGFILPTYKDACIQLGLLEDNGKWSQCLEEVGVMWIGSHHNLFALILNECYPAHLELLWERFCKNLCDDLAHHLHEHYQIPNSSNEDVLDFGLYLIDEILCHQSNKNLSEFPPMPIPIKNWSQQRANRFVEEQLIWNDDNLQLIINEQEPHFNEEQQHSYSNTLSARKSRYNIFPQRPSWNGEDFYI